MDNGADVVVDNLGGDVLPKHRRGTGQGVIVAFGFAAGTETTFDVGKFFFGQKQLIGFSVDRCGMLDVSSRELRGAPWGSPLVVPLRVWLKTLPPKPPSVRKRDASEKRSSSRGWRHRRDDQPG